MRVSWKEIACTSGRSLWCERTPSTNASTFMLSTLARSLSALYIVFDGLSITSCNHDSSPAPSWCWRKSCLANNAQMERAVTRMAGSPSAQSGRMRAIFAKCNRISFNRCEDGEAIDALAMQWTASKHTKSRRRRIFSSSPPEAVPGVVQLRKRVER